MALPRRKQVERAEAMPWVTFPRAVPLPTGFPDEVEHARGEEVVEREEEAEADAAAAEAEVMSPGREAGGKADDEENADEYSATDKMTFL